VRIRAHGEPSVLDLRPKKRARAGALFAEAGTSPRDLSREDLVRLFS
jgi:hypothetical protein